MTKTPLELNMKQKEKIDEFVELVYGDGISLSLSWEARYAEACRRLNFTPDADAFKEASKEYFFNHEEAELYWSYKIMFQNVCVSMREAEVSGEKGNENQSYRAKITNGLDMPKVMERLKELKAVVFKGNDQAVIDFNTGKRSSGFGTFMDELAKEKRA